MSDEQEITVLHIVEHHGNQPNIRDVLKRNAPFLPVLLQVLHMGLHLLGGPGGNRGVQRGKRRLSIRERGIIHRQGIQVKGQHLQPGLRPFRNGHKLLKQAVRRDAAVIAHEVRVLGGPGVLQIPGIILRLSHRRIALCQLLFGHHSVDLVHVVKQHIQPGLFQPRHRHDLSGLRPCGRIRQVAVLGGLRFLRTAARRRQAQSQGCQHLKKLFHGDFLLDFYVKFCILFYHIYTADS